MRRQDNASSQGTAIDEIAGVHHTFALGLSLGEREDAVPGLDPEQLTLRGNYCAWTRGCNRALGANEDLAEAIALAHDLGHSAFGHAGQKCSAASVVILVGSVAKSKRFLNQLIDATNIQITEATHFIITLGTAWVYRNIETNEIVANCHKVPQKQFTKELLSIETIHESLQMIISLITGVNKEAKFVLTVSPG